MNSISLQSDRKQWTIGDKQYSQEPFGLDRTAELFVLVGEVLQALSQSGDYDKFSSIDTAKPEAAMNLITILTRMAPAVLGSFIALCLDVTDPEEKKMIWKECRPVQSIGIIKVFMQQNDVNEIKESFLELRNLYQGMQSKSPDPESAQKPKESPASPTN